MINKNAVSAIECCIYCRVTITGITGSACSCYGSYNTFLGYSPDPVSCNVTKINVTGIVSNKVAGILDFCKKRRASITGSTGSIFSPKGVDITYNTYYTDLHSSLGG